VTSWARLIAPVSLVVLLAAPSSAAVSKSRVAGDPVIEAVVFDGVSMAEHGAILERIGVRVGDVLTFEARQRIGRRLNVVGDARAFSFANQGLTFSDRAGSRSGKVILVISAGC
jgi:outer membrane protein assembly factor BamA